MVKDNTRKQILNDIFYIVFYTVCMKPYMFNYYPLLDRFANIGRICFLAWYLAVYFIEIFRGNYKKYRAASIILIMNFIILIATISHHGNYHNCFIAMISTVILSIFLANNIRDIRNVVKDWFWIIYVFILINFINLFIGADMREDFLPVYFLGSKNNWGVLIPEYFLIIYLYQYFFPYNKRNIYVPIAIIIFTVIFTNSTTAVIELAIFAICIFFYNSKVIRRIANYWILLLIYAATNWVLLSGALLTRLTYFFEAILAKGSSSFLARIKMWESGLNIFINHPFLGIGKMNERMWAENVRAVSYHTQLHNQIVEYLATGGLALFLTYVYFLVLCGKQLDKYNNGNKVCYFFVVISFITNISVISEGKYYADFYLPFLFIFFIEFILSAKNESRK